MKNETSSWDEWLGTPFLTSKNVDNENQAFLVTNIESVKYKDDDDRLRLSLSSKGTLYLFDLNKTNSAFLKNAGIPNPSALVQKQIFFRKVMVQNPKEKKEVESLRIREVK